MNKKPFFISLVMVTAIMGGCAQQPATLQTGPGAEVTHDGLVRVDHAKLAAVWVRPDIDLKGYNKLILKGTEFQYKPLKHPNRSNLALARSGDNEFPLDDKQKEKLREVVANSFQSELSKSQHFSIVQQPGPQTLLVLGTLVDIVSNIPPETVSRTEVYLSTIGAATFVMELYDSETGAILARAVDRDVAESPGGQMTYSNPVTNKAEVDRLADSWARWLREGLERLAGPAS
jgi:hypothetical protein